MRKRVERKCKKIDLKEGESFFCFSFFGAGGGGGVGFKNP